MSYHYFLNWMGPINFDWIKKNGECWCGGRIDVSDGYNEFGVPIMLCEDWSRLSKFLLTYETKEIINLKQIVQDYYDSGNPKITWFDESRFMD